MKNNKKLSRGQAGIGYKVYTVLFNYNGAAFTIWELENDVGAISWSTTGTGDYLATLTGAFSGDKTVCFAGNDTTTEAVSFFSKSNNNSVSLKIRDINTGSANGISHYISLEIRVYD
tara:strand:+ start:547 stop:897 length:351 start_codon:yes stop_codon:yes gene_type:complete